MKQEIAFKHEFVEFIPEELKEGTLYVSIRFATVSHLCACGCKSKVVTPLKPTDWKLIFDGKTISLDPSIGNWSFPCQSCCRSSENEVFGTGVRKTSSAPEAQVICPVVIRLVEGCVLWRRGGIWRRNPDVGSAGIPRVAAFDRHLT